MFRVHRFIATKSILTSPECVLERVCCCDSFKLPSRWLFTRQREEKLPKPEPGFKIYYQGNLTPMVKMLKTFSLSTTITGMLIYAYMIKVGIIEKQQSTIAMTFMTATCGCVVLSPLLINLITKRYVTRLTYNEETNVFTVCSLNLFNQVKTTSFTADQVNSDTNRPMTTFTVNRKPFFVDPLQFSDLSVYERLMGYDKIKHLIDDDLVGKMNREQSQSSKLQYSQEETNELKEEMGERTKEETVEKAEEKTEEKEKKERRTEEKEKEEKTEEKEKKERKTEEKEKEGKKTEEKEKKERKTIR